MAFVGSVTNTIAPSPTRKLKGTFTSFKRSLKNGEEEFRTAIGVAKKSLGFEKHATQLGLFERREVEFRTYQGRSEDIPITIVTPQDCAYMHTFFDVCPISASGRYLAVTRLPFEHRSPYPGDIAEVCVVDLKERTIETVFKTQAWALQLGANIQWHPNNDNYLFCNTIENGRGVGVMIDRQAENYRKYTGPFYAVDPDGQYVYGPALDLLNRTQIGYGIPEQFVNRRNLDRGASRQEGVWRTDLESGNTELLVSIYDLVKSSPDYDLLMNGTNILFHTKINMQGTKIFQVVRSIDLPDKPGAIRSRIITFDIDGSDIREVLSHRSWDRGGHHPSWLADGATILMNLVPENDTELRFVMINQNTCQYQVLDKYRGSGHPTIERSGSYLITDAYLNEGFGDEEMGAPLRLIDLGNETEQVIAQMDCGPPNLRARRVDPHPVWSRDQRSVVCNGIVNGKRQVMIADLSSHF